MKILEAIAIIVTTVCMVSVFVASVGAPSLVTPLGIAFIASALTTLIIELVSEEGCL